jgi:branched-chain amino acid transport system ATP-binding protein
MTMAAKRAVLELRDVRRSFGRVDALAGVSLAFGGEGIVGLIGPNGSGKTTLVNIVSGFLRPSAGEVTWEGRSIVGVSAHRMVRLGISRTFQQNATFATLTVRENAVIALEQAGRADEHVNVLLDEDGSAGSLIAYADEIAGELPFGMARLLGIALAVASRPKLLLLDEPAAGLNDSEAAALASSIGRIREAGTSILIIDHDMAFLFPLCERVVVLDAGSLVGDGTPDEIRSDPRIIEIYLGVGIAPS